MVWFDIQLIAGPYRRMYFELALLPMILIDLVTISLCIFLCITTRCRRADDGNNSTSSSSKWGCCGKKEKDPFKYYPMKKISFDEITSRKKIVLEPVDELEFDNSPPKPRSKYGSVITWMIIISLAYTGIALVIFDYWSVYWGLPIITIFLWLFWFLLLPNSSSPNQRGGRAPLSIFEEQMYKPGKMKLYLKSLLTKAKQRPAAFWGGMLFWLTMVFIGCFFGNGICITAGDPMIISTRFTRSFLPDLCTGPAPCHVYLTMPESTVDSMIVHFQTPNHLPSNAEARLYYDITSHSNDTLLSAYPHKLVATTYVYKSMDIERSIHWVVLDGLKPATQYYFRVGYVKDKSSDTNDDTDSQFFTEEKSLITGPAHGPFTFVSGGDVSISPLAEEMMGLAAQSNPLFVMLGGDITYANGMETCYRSWDVFLNRYEKQLTGPRGNLIPLIMAPGNHEGGGYLQSVDHIPFLMKWFAQSRINQEVDKRLTYHVHTVSDNTMILALDSMISATPGGPQLDWMKLQFSTFADQYPNRLPLYHVPLYPSNRGYNNGDSRDLRKYWGPVFDQYNVSIAFENHDHSYKRTKLIRNNQVDPLGTLYVGDGSFGVIPRSPKSDLWYMETTQATTFFFKVDVGYDSMEVTAIGRKGVIIDSFSKSFYPGGNATLPADARRRASHLSL